MKLYYNEFSSNSRRALATAFHLGLDLEKETVDWNELRNPDYLRINPNAKVPVLVDGDFVLWESNAIMQYFCEKSGDTKLWPKDLKTRMDVVRWQFWSNAHFAASVAMIVGERVVRPMRAPGTPMNEGFLLQGVESFHRFAQVLDSWLQDREWLVGKSITLADYAVGAPLMYTQVAGLPVDPYPQMMRWYQRIEEQDAWKKTAPGGR
jgi:glutathione S-transferase